MFSILDSMALPVHDNGHATGIKKPSTKLGLTGFPIYIFPSAAEP